MQIFFSKRVLLLVLTLGFTFTFLSLPCKSFAQRLQNRTVRPQPAGEKATAQPGQIRGRVVAIDNGQGLSKVTISLVPIDRREDDRPLTAKTTADGYYEVKQVPPSQYRLFASRNGYARQGYGQKPGRESDLSSTTPLEVRAGETLDNIDLVLVRGGAIEGRIFDQDGEPAARVSVTLVRSTYVNGQRTLRPSSSDQTDDRGQFRIYDVPPGTYYLMAAMRVFGMTDENRGVYPSIYFPGVLDPQEATKVKMVAGGELRGYDMSLLETTSFKISGKVISPDGQPQRRVFVTAVKLPSSGFQPNAPQSVGSQGDFTLRGLVPGSYRLTAQERREDQLLTGSVVVDVGNQDIAGVLLPLGNGAELQGRVVFEGSGQPPNLASLRVSTLSVGGDSGPGFRFRGPMGAAVKDDGTFTLKDLAEGPVQLVVSRPSGNSYVKSIRAQGKDVTDGALELRSGDRLQGVEIVIASDGAQLSGTVKDGASGQTVSDATILIYPADAHLVGPNSRYIRTITGGKQGEFSFHGLVPGEYRLCALVDHESGIEYDPEYLQSLNRFSKTVQLSAGQASSENLEVAASPRAD
jgi:Carboxypeptidase regulatory-like domain